MFLSELKGGIPLSFTLDSVGKHLMDAIGLLSNEASRKGVQFSLSGGSDLFAPADWNNMNKAFLYILDNAVKSCPENGTVSVEVQEQNDDCVIRIGNEGEGIDAEMIGSVAEGSDETIGDDGVSAPGLSLAIAKYIFGLHGGSIEVESPSGTGSALIIRLPLVRT
jgi:signal transduction histidine kinase